MYLRNAREEAGLSQVEVANNMGYSTPQFISNWERGVSHPPLSSVRKLARIYKANADKILDEIQKAKIQAIVDEVKQYR